MVQKPILASSRESRQHKAPLAVSFLVALLRAMMRSSLIDFFAATGLASCDDATINAASRWRRRRCRAVSRASHASSHSDSSHQSQRATKPASRFRNTCRDDTGVQGGGFRFPRPLLRCGEDRLGTRFHWHSLHAMGLHATSIAASMARRAIAHHALHISSPGRRRLSRSSQARPMLTLRVARR